MQRYAKNAYSITKIRLNKTGAPVPCVHELD